MSWSLRTVTCAVTATAFEHRPTLPREDTILKGKRLLHTTHVYHSMLYVQRLNYVKKENYSGRTWGYLPYKGRYGHVNAMSTPSDSIKRRDLGLFRIDIIARSRHLNIPMNIRVSHDSYVHGKDWELLVPLFYLDISKASYYVHPTS